MSMSVEIRQITKKPLVKFRGLGHRYLWMTLKGLSDQDVSKCGRTLIAVNGLFAVGRP
jgi:hypothetical protein